MITEEIADMAKLIQEKCGLSFLRSIGIAQLVYDANYRKIKRGVWQLIGYGNNRVISWKCSVCNGEVFDASNGDTDFCPNCGADMRGNDDEK